MSQRTRVRTSDAAPSAAPDRSKTFTQVEGATPLDHAAPSSPAGRAPATPKRRQAAAPTASGVQESPGPSVTPEPAESPELAHAPAAVTAHPLGAEPGLAVGSATLARALRAVADALDRDPALAERVARAVDGAGQMEAAGEAHAVASPTPPTPPSPVEPEHDGAAPVAKIGRRFRPTLVTGVDDALGPGVPDPFAIRAQRGEEGLREALATLRLGSLRAMMREYRLDPSGRLSGVNDADKLRARIMTATKRPR